MKSMDLFKAFGDIDDNLVYDTINNSMQPQNASGAAPVKQPKPDKPRRGGAKTKAIAIGAVAAVLAAAIICMILYFTGVFGGKQVPIYTGMEISAVDTTSSTNSTGAVSYHYSGDYYGRSDDIDKDKPFGNGSATIEQQTQSTLQVAGAGESIYYADAGDDIYITIKFSNPDSYEILSFVINGDKYTSYMFETGSDLENIIIKVNVGTVGGIIEYTISEIKYVDGTEIKNVTMEGDPVVKCGVRTSDITYATISDEATTLTSISFTAKIVDLYSLVEYSDGYVKAVLYDGESIVQMIDLEIGTNEVVFDNLTPDTLYQYAVVGYFDNLSGGGTALNYLYTNAVYTPAVVLFDSISITQDSVMFGYSWYTGYQGTITSLTLTGGGTTQTLSASAASAANLLSDTTYTLTAYYTGTSGEIESITLEFTTEAKATPSVSVSSTSTQTEISYDLSITDTDKVGSLTSVTLSLNGEAVQTLTTSSGTFTGLLSDNAYTLTAVYTYDLNDGTGSHTAEATNTITTQAKATPAVEISMLESAQESISYSLSITDTDSVGTKTEVTLSLNGEAVQTLTTSNGTFTGLLSDNTYTLTAVYTYDLNDGTGSHTMEDGDSITTKAKAAPGVEIEVTDATTSSLTFNVVLTDTDGVGKITAIALYNGSTLVKSETILNQVEYNYSGLSSYTEYTLKVSYSYDLNDGAGSHVVEQTIADYTDPVIEFNSISVLNRSDISEGNTIVIEAEMTNPSGVTFSSVVVNGTTYSASSVSTTTKLRVEIVNNGQFAGGDTTLTITQINCAIGGKTYTVDASTNNAVSVFINGALTVESFSIARYNSESGKYEETNYGFPDEQLYYLISLSNATKYNIDSVTIGDTVYSSEITMIDENQTAYISISSSFNTGSSSVTLSSISYSNNSINKTEAVNCTTDFTQLSSKEIVEITTAEQLLDVDDYKYYKLMNDIDLSSDQWTNKNNDMYGVFDGNGYTISGMGDVYTYSNTDLYIGLFKSVTGVVTNLTIDNALYMITVNNASGDSYIVYAGGLAAKLNAVVMDNVTVDISMSITINGSSGNNYIGGLFGYCVGGGSMIKDVTVTAVIQHTSESSYSYIGGLFGYYYGIGAGSYLDNIKADIKFVITAGGQPYVGGLIGWCDCNREYNISNVSLVIDCKLTTTGNFSAMFGEAVGFAIADSSGTFNFNNVSTKLTGEFDSRYYQYDVSDCYYGSSLNVICNYEDCTRDAIITDSINNVIYYYDINFKLSYTNGEYTLVSYIGTETDVVVPDGVTAIGDSAFSGCTTITSVTISDGVTYIGSSAFYGCTSLINVTIPDSVTSIGYGAFSGCTSLTSITIPESVTSLDSYVFDNCTALTSIVIPDGVTTISGYAFYGCSSLTSIVLPESLSAVLGGAFGNCTALTTVYFGGTEAEWETIYFDNNQNDYLTSATVYYYSESKPAESGNYWHYVKGVATPW